MNVFERDLAAIFADSTMAVEASTPCGYVRGVLEIGEYETNTNFGREVVRDQAVFTTSACAPIEVDDPIEINEVSYRVAIVIDDGTGVKKLFLERM